MLLLYLLVFIVLCRIAVATGINRTGARYSRANTIVPLTFLPCIRVHDKIHYQSYSRHRADYMPLVVGKRDNENVQVAAHSYTIIILYTSCVKQ